MRIMAHLVWESNRSVGVASEKGWEENQNFTDRLGLNRQRHHRYSRCADWTINRYRNVSPLVPKPCDFDSARTPRLFPLTMKDLRDRNPEGVSADLFSKTPEP